MDGMAAARRDAVAGGEGAQMSETIFSARGTDTAERDLSSTAHLSQRAPEPLVAGHALRKRAFDVLVASALVLVLAPLLALVALLVRIDSRGPVLFHCRRIGFGGRAFRMAKFRKMHHHASGAQLTMADDHRFTRAGKWLAGFKIDELPQLWNVVRGEMSLVGPRPESPDFVDHYPDDYAEITRVRPGVLGLSQLAFAEESQILDSGDPVGHYLGRILPQKMALDRMYAERWSLWLDTKIILWTLVALILRRPVAVDRATGKMGLRKR
jgi:lipopolysaccharide/colanic/teichoic acid biosynthesis glycosyltransferase